MADSFRFQMQPKRTDLLLLGKLSALVDGKMVAEWPATSGIRYRQGLLDIWTRGKGLIPPSTEVQDPYRLGTEKAHSNNFKAVGEFIYTIWPLNVWCKDRLRKRSNFGLHFDANHKTSPGSGGCIVLIDETEWESLQAYLDNLFAEGVREIPLEVMYV